MLAAIALPGFLRAQKRSQATLVKNDLRLIDDAIAQYALETNRNSGDTVEVDDWIDYIKDGRLYETGQDVLGDFYGDQLVDTLPTVPSSTWDALRQGRRYATAAPQAPMETLTTRQPAPSSIGNPAFFHASQLPGTFQSSLNPAGFRMLAAILERYPLPQ